jgi:hypothetical protein
MRARAAFASGVVLLCLAAPAAGAVVSYRAVLDPGCTYCSGGDLPGTGLFEATWDDSTFDLDHTISYDGLTQDLQAIRFLDRVTGADFNGQLGPLFPEDGEELAGGQAGTFLWFGDFPDLAASGDLDIGFATLIGPAYEIGGTIVVPEPGPGALRAAALLALLAAARWTPLRMRACARRGPR